MTEERLDSLLERLLARFDSPITPVTAEPELLPQLQLAQEGRYTTYRAFAMGNMPRYRFVFPPESIPQLIVDSIDVLGGDRIRINYHICNPSPGMFFGIDFFRLIDDAGISYNPSAIVDDKLIPPGDSRNGLAVFPALKPGTSCFFLDFSGFYRIKIDHSSFQPQP